MSNIDLVPYLQSVNFVESYQNICERFNDFDNRIRGNKKDVYDSILSQLGYEYEYFSKEQFYRITSQEGGHEFILQLVLKDGIVEPMLNIKWGDNYYFPNGRFDFIPKKMGVEFDRKKYNLPKYTSEAELESILKDIFSIYEDIKKKVIESQGQQLGFFIQ